MQIELHEIIHALAPIRAQQVITQHGVAIVIADRGHVWVGDVETGPEWCVIRRAKTVRQWGTTRGLGEIAQGGPTSKTVLDDVREVRLAMRALIAVVPCEAAKWAL